MKTWIASVLVIVTCATGVRGEEAEKPDFASYDKAVLVILCENQHHEIQLLREEVEDLKKQIAAGHGGSKATVTGNVTSIADGSWVVTLNSVVKPDTTGLEAEVARLREELHGQATTRNTSGQYVGSSIDAKLTEAKRREQAVLAKGKYKKVVRHSGETVRNAGNPNGYRDAERREATAAVTSLERQKKAAERKILDLERRIEIERNSVSAHGVTDDGVPVTLTASGVHAHVGRILEPNKTFTVTGRGVFDVASGKITVKTAVAVRATPLVESG